MIKPNFQKLWLGFPDHAKYQTLKDLYTALGGAAQKISIYLASAQMEILARVA